MDRRRGRRKMANFDGIEAPSITTPVVAVGIFNVEYERDSER
jgi:hypothetical protein